MTSKEEETIVEKALQKEVQEGKTRIVLREIISKIGASPTDRPDLARTAGAILRKAGWTQFEAHGGLTAFRKPVTANKEIENPEAVRKLIEKIRAEKERKARRPEYKVKKPKETENGLEEIGVAWKNTDKNGKEFFTIRLTKGEKTFYMFKEE